MRLVVDKRIHVDLDETSDVVALPSGWFLVVSDTEARAALVADGQPTSYLSLPGVDTRESSIEAVAYDAEARRLICHAEDQGELFVLAWDGRPTSSATLQRRRTLQLGKRKNKGVEGLTHLAAALSPTGRAGLLIANEAKPRALFFLHDAAAPDEDPAEIELLPGLTASCEDFSGLALDSSRNSVLVVSDESASLVEIQVRRDGETIVARAVSAYDLVDEAGDALERVEGVAVDDASAWWVLLENDRTLCRLRRP